MYQAGAKNQLMTFQLYHSAKALSGLYGNKLAQVWDFTHHFFVSCFRLEVNTILDRMFFGVRYKKGIQSMRAFKYWQLYLYLNSLLITGWYIYLLKSQQSTAKKICSFDYILCSYVGPLSFEGSRKIFVICSSMYLSVRYCYWCFTTNPRGRNNAQSSGMTERICHLICRKCSQFKVYLVILSTKNRNYLLPF